MTRRGVITRVVTCLVLGAVTTVAVAWGFGHRVEQHHGHMTVSVTTPHPETGESVTVFCTAFWSDHATDTLGLRSRDGDVELVLPANAIDEAFAVQPVRRVAGKLEFLHLPEWMRGRRVLVPAILDEHLGQGWPFRCVRGIYSWRSRSSTGLFRVRSTAQPTGGSLALIPIWPGLAADATIFGAVWAVPVFGWPMLRARRRRRRGWCAACGYDLGGDAAGGCPECGWGK